MAYAAVVDTNIFVRIITNDQPGVAKSVLKRIMAMPVGSILVDSAMIAEVVYVLTSPKLYGFARNEAVEALKAVLALQQFSYAQDLLAVTLEAFATTKLAFVDCLMLAHYLCGEVDSILTRDKALLKQTGLV